MPEQVLARGNTGSCSKAPPDDDDIAISASVGVGGVNNKNDVRIIQAALNDVDPKDGGPVTPLNEDGISGPLTTKAIAKFQQRQLGFADSRVDRNGPTLRALNGQGGGAPVAARTVGAGVTAPRPRRQKKPELQPNPFLVPMIESLLPEIKVAIRAANFQLTLAQPFVGNQKQKLPQGPFLAPGRASLKLLDVVFGFFSFANPRPVHERLRLAFRNMEVALNRAFETSPLASKSLFAPNTKESMEKIDKNGGFTVAHTTAGGAFAGPGERNSLGLPNDLIFLCGNLASLAREDIIMTAIHELAHYVSPVNDPTGDPANGLFFKDQPRMDALQPRQKIRNAEHYAAYAVLCAGRPGDPAVAKILRDLLN